MKVKEVEVEGRRYVICLNEEEKRKDAHDRAAIVESLGKALKSGDKSLVGNKGFRRFLKTEGGSHFAIDEKQILADERYDGLFVLRLEEKGLNAEWAEVIRGLNISSSLPSPPSFFFGIPIIRPCPSAT